jgi:hypothetical protein
LGEDLSLVKKKFGRKGKTNQPYGRINTRRRIALLQPQPTPTPTYACGTLNTLDQYIQTLDCAFYFVSIPLVLHFYNFAEHTTMAPAQGNVETMPERQSEEAINKLSNDAVCYISQTFHKK